MYVYTVFIWLPAKFVSGLEIYCSALREYIGDMAGEETAVAEALLRKLKVVHVCNYSSLPDRLTGNLPHGTLPCLSEKRSDSQSVVSPCKESSSLCGQFLA
jgi:hypothetical protein